MKRRLLAISVSCMVTAAWGLDTAGIERASGLKGKLDESGKVFKVEKARSDLSVRVGGVSIKPPQGLTSWAAFQGEGERAMMMGDIVLTEAEVDPAMSAALDNGLEVTALHNHFLFDSPRVMFMHIAGRGSAGKLAAAVGAVMKAGRSTAGKTAPLEAGSLDAEALEGILGGKAESKDGKIFKFIFEKKTKVYGEEMGKAMGLNTWAAFAGSERDAVVDGDFAMVESELQDVVKALRKGGLSVVAIHSHMVMETPRIMFLHFWGRGAARDLAKAVKSALDVQQR